MGLRRYAPVISVLIAIGGFLSGTVEASAASPYTETARYNNPVRQVQGLQAVKVDQGADFLGTGPVFPIGDGVVDFACRSNCGWPGLGRFIAYHLTKGPAAMTGKGPYEIYVAECLLIATGLNPGSILDSQHKIGDMSNCDPGSNGCPSTGCGIETGWADPNNWTLAAGHSQETTINTVTAYGDNFDHLLVALGVHRGQYLTAVNGSVPLSFGSASPAPTACPTTWSSSILVARTAFVTYQVTGGLLRENVNSQLKRFVSGSQWCLLNFVSITNSDGSAPSHGEFNLNVRFSCNGAWQAIRWAFDFSMNNAQQSVATGPRSVSCTHWSVDNEGGSYGSQVVDDSGTTFNYGLPSTTNNTALSYSI